MVEKVAEDYPWEEQDLCHILQAGCPGRDSLALVARYERSAGASAASVLVLTQHRSTSATLQACATQPRGVNGSSASKISLMEPIQASLTWASKLCSKRWAPARSSG